MRRGLLVKEYDDHKTPRCLDLSRWRGEFAEPAMEVEFQDHVRDHELRRFIVVLQVTGPLYFAFVISDYLALGPTRTFLINFVLRLMVLPYCWRLAARLQAQQPIVPQLHRLSLWFFLIVLTNAFVIYPFSQRTFDIACQRYHRAHRRRGVCGVAAADERRGRTHPGRAAA